MTTVEVLEAARARVEKGWIQGRSVEIKDNRAVAWCATGAIDHKGGDGGDCQGCSAGDLLIRVIGCDGPIARWNDTPGRTQADVLAAFDKAIALARSAQ